MGGPGALFWMWHRWWPIPLNALMAMAHLISPLMLSPVVAKLDKDSFDAKKAGLKRGW